MKEPDVITLADLEATDAASAQKVARAAAALRSRRPEVTDIGESIAALRDEIEDEMQEARDAGPASEALLDRFISNSESLSRIELLQISQAVELYRGGNRRVDRPALDGYRVPIKGQFIGETTSNRDTSFAEAVLVLHEQAKTRRETAELAKVENERRDAEQVRLLELALTTPLLREVIEIAMELHSPRAKGTELPPMTLDPRWAALNVTWNLVNVMIEAEEALRGLNIHELARTFAKVRGLACTPDQNATGGARITDHYTAQIPSNEQSKPKRGGLFTGAFTTKKRTEVSRS